MTTAVHLIRPRLRFHFSTIFMVSKRCPILTLKRLVSELHGLDGWMDAGGGSSGVQHRGQLLQLLQLHQAPPAAAAPPRRSVPARQQRTQLPHISKKKNSGKIGRFLFRHSLPCVLFELFGAWFPSA